jgi:hypothetical protein
MVAPKESPHVIRLAADQSGFDHFSGGPHQRGPTALAAADERKIVPFSGNGPSR